jgi:DNA-binding GntR family transcriptional regulator
MVDRQFVLDEVSQPTLAERAYEKLLEAIASGSFRSEQKLTVAALADQLGLSPTPINQALHRLVGEGFIQFVPRRGFLTTSITAARFSDIYDARLMCELYGLRQLAGEPDIHLVDQLEQLADEYGRRWELDGPPNYLLEVDEQFHLHIVELSKNPLIQDWFQKLAVHRWEMYLQLYHRDKYRLRQTSRDEHYAIVGAIKDGDATRASALLAEHIDNAKSHLLELIARDVSPLAKEV